VINNELYKKEMSKFSDYWHKCKEVKVTWKGEECRLFERINEIRNDLLNKCELFEKILDMDCNESLEELIKDIP
jgi:hypothetical protein